VRLFVPPGVLRPPPDAWLLARALAAEGPAPGTPALDVCTGSGVLAVAAARQGLATTAVDVGRRAVLAARVNARLNGVRVRVRRGDLFAPVAGERFGLIVSNPPYLPAATDQLPRRGVDRATDAGRTGRALLDRIAAETEAHLRPGGVLLLVFSSLCGEEAVLESLRAGGLEPEVTTRRRGPLGPILRARAEQLEAQGLLAPGEREEDVLIVRAGRAAPSATGGAQGSSASGHGSAKG
jgi:release factor glutamine methyltransferase